MIENPNYSDLMEKGMLAQIEELCTQEQPPACNAACPLHVDAKGIIAAISQGNFQDAFRVYAKKVSFPRLLAYVCDGVCEQKCKRTEVDDPIQIHALERTMIEHANTTLKVPPFLPKTNHTVIVIGANLYGMTAALELAKKGHTVHLVEKENEIGGALAHLSEDILPKTVLLETKEYLTKYGVSIHLETEENISDSLMIDALLERYNAGAVILAAQNSLWGTADEKTAQVNASNIFTGTRLPHLKNSYVGAMYDGKSVANTVDRYLKNVSLYSGREEELTFETSLFTDITNLTPSHAIQMSGSSYTTEEAIQEASRCIQCECMECVKGCTFMQEYKSYPNRYVREVYNNLSIVMGIHHGNKMINSCNLCGQCESICPNNLSMKEVFLTARKKMVENGKMPPSAFDFALMDLEYSNGEDFYHLTHQSGFDKSSYLFFPGCQLPAAEAELTLHVYEDLCHTLEGGVGIFLACCSIMALWAGDEPKFKEEITKLSTAWENAGKPTLITSCPTCKETFETHTDIKVIGIWEILLQKKQALKPVGVGKTLTIHDACGARYDGDTQTAIRTLAKNAGYQIEEFEFSKETVPCCGYGGLMRFSNPELSRKTASERTKSTAHPTLTYCSNCRDQFLKTGTESFHLLEILYPDKVQLNHHAPTWSERQHARRRVKQDILKTRGETPLEEINCTILISEELTKILDERMILESDIKETILQSLAEKTYMQDTKTGHLIASFKRRNVTFWVVFTESEEAGYLIHNAYSHRMNIKEREGAQ